MSFQDQPPLPGQPPLPDHSLPNDPFASRSHPDQPDSPRTQSPQDAPPASRQEPPLASVQAGDSDSAPFVPDEARQASSGGGMKTGAKILWGVLGLVIVAFVGFGVWYFFSGGKSSITRDRTRTIGRKTTVGKATAVNIGHAQSVSQARGIGEYDAGCPPRCCD